MLRNEDIIALATVRLQQARECLSAAENGIVVEQFKNSANRSYYCIYHAIRAVLAFDEFDSNKHSGVISFFRKNYIKTGIFPPMLSDIIKISFEVRNDCDYQDFYMISKEMVKKQFENAKMFLETIEKYITPKLTS